ncbi:hypothetical protein [Rathayibacter sp. VKM Ac-2801]|uniref:hypothetical protein n=1 Tax=Rathayibacter sp. VKM Ac-2801 TaxID=2609255 RepID=UPI00131F6CD8|nr:hypothetical protein [Rathayibacter sp. VKM Ac-2801]QHC70844.1 hypothetical protein GSU45_11025 [Rathayibacter sp. VKM Ac-2801]
MRSGSALPGGRTGLEHDLHAPVAQGLLELRRRRCVGDEVVGATELRYLLGDGFTAADYDGVAALPPQPGSEAVCGAVESALEACCVPGLVLETDRPTTIGLGDTFAGGFVSALARGEH